MAKAKVTTGVPDVPVEPDEEPLPLPKDRDWPRPWMSAFFEALSTLPDVSLAARHAGISRQTVYRWKNTSPRLGERWRPRSGWAFRIWSDKSSTVCFRNA